jgi:hypothetical protein
MWLLHPLKGGVLDSQMLRQGLVMQFSLILTGSCSKVLFFLVKIFIYFKQQIHEINSLKKLEWLILKFCRKLSFFSSKIYFGAKLTKYVK